MRGRAVPARAGMRCDRGGAAPAVWAAGQDGWGTTGQHRRGRPARAGLRSTKAATAGGAAGQYGAGVAATGLAGRRGAVGGGRRRRRQAEKRSARVKMKRRAGPGPR
jgi:hypothetical protein